MDGIDAIGDVLEGDVLAGEDVGDIEEAVVPADGAIAADAAEFEVGRIVEAHKALWEDFGRRAIVVGGHIQTQGLMRAFGVIDGTEAIESPLLSAERAGGWTSGFGLEGAVEAFMAAVLLRVSGLDRLGANAQMKPPNLEFGEAEDGLSGKRDAIIQQIRAGRPNWVKRRSKTGRTNGRAMAGRAWQPRR